MENSDPQFGQRDDSEYLEEEIDGQVRYCPKCEAPRTGSCFARDGVTMFIQDADEVCIYEGEGESVREGVMMLFTHQYKE